MWVGGWVGGSLKPKSYTPHPHHLPFPLSSTHTIHPNPHTQLLQPNREGLTLDRFVVEHRDLAEAIEGTRQKLDPTALRRVGG